MNATDAQSTFAIKSSELIAGLSRALDLTEGEPMGHSIRACWIGMQLGQELQLGDDIASELYYALLLKDAGCSSNAAQVSSWFGTDDHSAKMDLKVVNWSKMAQAVLYAVRHAAPGAPFMQRLHQMVALSRRGISASKQLVQVRCTRGAQLVNQLGWSGDVPDAVFNLDEHWDGSGSPRGMKGHEIPLMARILLLAQTAEIFWTRRGADAARAVVRGRRGSWFDPELVDVFLTLSSSPEFFHQLSEVNHPRTIQAAFPKVAQGFEDVSGLLRTAEIFGQIVDAKSPWTRLHSIRTAQYAKRIAKAMNRSAHDQDRVLLAGYFHDLGKLGVSNLLLDKPGKLNPDERKAVEQHAELTYQILEPLESLKDIAYVASCHHERLDGSGYFRHLEGSKVPLHAQIIAVADVFDALTARRPYRDEMSAEEAFTIMRPDIGPRLNGNVMDALEGLPHPLQLDDQEFSLHGDAVS